MLIKIFIRKLNITDYCVPSLIDLPKRIIDIVKKIFDSVRFFEIDISYSWIDDVYNNDKMCHI